MTVKGTLYIDRIEMRILVVLWEFRDRQSSHLTVVATVFPSSIPHGIWREKCPPICIQTVSTLHTHVRSYVVDVTPSQNSQTSARPIGIFFQ